MMMMHVVQNGATALHCAALNGQYAALQSLLEAKAIMHALNQVVHRFDAANETTTKLCLF